MTMFTTVPVACTRQLRQRWCVTAAARLLQKHFEILVPMSVTSASQVQMVVTKLVFDDPQLFFLADHLKKLPIKVQMMVA